MTCQLAAVLGLPTHASLTIFGGRGLMGEEMLKRTRVWTQRTANSIIRLTIVSRFIRLFIPFRLGITHRRSFGVGL